MIRKHKQYKRPRKLYDSVRIAEENKLAEKYGLKNKKEIWKTESTVGDMRNQAKILITKTPEEQKVLFNKLNRIGLKVKSIADVLGLGKEDLLKRRLQSLIVEKKLASTPKQARQLIVHKHVAINGNVINIPSYIVKVDEEDKIEIITAITVKTKEEKEAEKSARII